MNLFIVVGYSKVMCESRSDLFEYSKGSFLRLHKKFSRILEYPILIYKKILCILFQILRFYLVSTSLIYVSSYFAERLFNAVFCCKYCMFQIVCEEIFLPFIILFYDPFEDSNNWAGMFTLKYASRDSIVIFDLSCGFSSENCMDKSLLNGTFTEFLSSLKRLSTSENFSDISTSVQA